MSSWSGSALPGAPVFLNQYLVDDAGQTSGAASDHGFGAYSLTYLGVDFQRGLRGNIHHRRMEFHQRVEAAAEAVRRLLDQGREARVGQQLRLHPRSGTGPRRVELLCQCRGAVRRAVAVDHHPRPLGVSRPRDRGADATRAAGDEDHGGPGAIVHLPLAACPEGRFFERRKCSELRCRFRCFVLLS